MNSLSGIIAAALAGAVLIVLTGAGTLVVGLADPPVCPVTSTIATSRWATSLAGRGPEAVTDAAPPTGRPTASTSPPDPTAGCRDGQGVLRRASTWMSAWGGGPVPYLSSTDSSTWFEGYRRDCSGYASMALGLPGPGLDTSALAARSLPIAKTDLRPGDLFINPGRGPAGHVVIFDHWTDPTMSNYLGFEQSGDGGTHHRVIPYPYFGTYPMSAYRAR